MPPSKFRSPSFPAGIPGGGGVGTCLLLNLDHPPSCNSSTEIPVQGRSQVEEGEGTRLPLKIDHPPSQREYQVGEGEGTCLLLNLDHPPSCNISTEIPAQGRSQVEEGEGASPPLNLDHPPSQREYQVEEGEGTCLLPNLDHSPSCNSSSGIPSLPPGSKSPQEIPAQWRRGKGGTSHHPGRQLA